MADPEEGRDRLRLAMMGIGEMIEPWHEWLAGEFAYYVRQGYTHEQARAMAASVFTTVVGSRIEPTATRPDD